MSRIRILLGDDHALISKGISSILEPDYDVIGIAGDGRQLVEMALSLSPDLVILDVAMPLLNGIEAARRIKAARPATKLVFVSMHANPMYLRRALDAGATAYVLKSGVADELRLALTETLSGNVYVSPGFGRTVLETRWNRSGKPTREAEGLTGRQREILQMIVNGRQNKEIAHILGISIKTVEFHRGRIMARLGVHSTVDLTRIAIEQGLIAASSA